MISGWRFKGRVRIGNSARAPPVKRLVSGLRNNWTPALSRFFGLRTLAAGPTTGLGAIHAFHGLPQFSRPTPHRLSDWPVSLDIYYTVPGIPGRVRAPDFASVL